jgi:hypothetical protein
MTRFSVPKALVAVAASCCALACSDPVPSPVASNPQPTAGASPIGGSGAGSGVAGTNPTVGGGGAASGEAGGAAGSGVGGAAAGQSGASGASAGAGAAAGAGGSSGAGAGGGASGGAPSVVDLFNGTDLTGFNVYRQNQEKAPGTLLSGAQALAIFKPENGTIHVYADAPDQSPQVHYTLVTAKSYSKYKLTWDYKWGTKKFAPYTDLVKYPRDAGVLWHLHGDITQLWPPSMEFQNKDGTTGDIFALYARCTSPGSASDKTVFAEGGASVLVDGSNGFVQHGRSANYEVVGDWTPCLMEVNGGTATYTVNGHIVNRVLSVMDAKGQPVSSGPIAWQAEQAEVYYRNLRIEVLP